MTVRVWSRRPGLNGRPAVYESVNGGLPKYLRKWAIPSSVLAILILAFLLILAACDSFLTELSLSLTL